MAQRRVHSLNITDRFLFQGLRRWQILRAIVQNIELHRLVYLRNRGNIAAGVVALRLAEQLRLKNDGVVFHFQFEDVDVELV